MSRVSSAALALSLATTPALAQFNLGEVNQDLGVLDSTPVQVLFEGVPGEDVYASVVMNGVEIELNLRPHNVLAEGFQLLEQVADGSLVQVPHEAPATYRGFSHELGGVTVAASWLGDGLHARLMTHTGENYWIQPVSAKHGGTFGDHVLYAGADIVEEGGLCGLEDEIHFNQSVPVHPSEQGGGQTFASSGLQVAELGCDADFEYYQAYGSSSTNVMNRITSVINTMNLQYEAQTSLTHSITAIVVRTSSNNPYTSNNSSTLLNQFRSEWLANQGSIQRDVAQLFTGKNLLFGTIGVAWLGSVCGSFGYSLVESDFSTSFACATDLSAHELGHTWNAGHCFCSTTMNSFITCANSFNNGSINAITNFANVIGCLSSSSCTQQATTSFYNGGGTNMTCLTSVGVPVTGSNWTIDIDTSGVPGATLSGVMAKTGSSSGTFLGSSEILIDLSSTTIFFSTVNGGGGVNSHTFFVDPSLLGQSLTVQGAVRTNVSPALLCNAENAVVGCAP